jgi:hypothetical protein
MVGSPPVRRKLTQGVASARVASTIWMPGSGLGLGLGRAPGDAPGEAAGFAVGLAAV